MKTDRSEYLIVVDTASLLQAPSSDQIFVELEFDTKLSKSKLERFIKERVIANVSLAEKGALANGNRRDFLALKIIHRSS